jgi:two-component system phosphate regulon sensor histidine kinase PhoR
MRNGSEQNREVRLPAERRDRVLLLQASPLRDAAGELSGAVLVLHDVTELRHLEEVRRDFVANVSHEVKTPLTAIRGMVETILEDPSMDEPTRNRFLERVRSQAGRLSALVTDLLTLSRVERREEAPEKGTLDLRGPVRESFEQQTSEGEDKGLSMEIETPDSPVPVFGDMEALRQAVDNLLSNAVRYTPSEGRIWVRLRTEGEFAVVEVQDTGIGIEPRHQERVFERFYRVDKARSRELGGTGLGLSIVKHITIAHEGSVSLESAPGQGSTFRIRLPLRHAD